MKLRTKILSIALVAGIIAISCQKKESTGIAPTFAATGNPNPGNQTVTGTTTYTNPATENSALYVGGIGWTNPTCGSTSSITLKGYNNTTDVTLSFAGVIRTGTYAIAAVPSGTVACALTLVNAPDQPAGIIWYGKSGQVSVYTTSTSINATMNNIICTQQTFFFPTVNVNGVLGCSQ